MQLANNSIPALRTTPGSWVQEDVADTLSTKKALLLVRHSFKVD